MADKSPTQKALASLATHNKASAVDIRTAADMLGVCHVTVRREIDRGALRAVRIGRVWRVRLTAIEEYLKRKEDLLQGDMDE